MSKLFSSIRWKILLAFLLIIGLSFLVMAGTLTNMLGRYLYEQRIRQDRTGLEKWAVQTAPSLYAAQMDKVAKQLTEAGNELGGRVLLLDADGKVQGDSFGEMAGMRLAYPEVASVLVQGRTGDYGIHTLTGEAPAGSEALLSRMAGEGWVSLSTAGVIQASQVIGVLVLASSVRAMMQNLYLLQDNMVMIFVAVALAAILSGMLFSSILTNPIAELTRGIQRMGKGDFSARVPEKGSGEIRHMAQAFNSMSGKLETLEHSRNQFVSDASHELKTPLATMKIMIESLIYQPDMEEELRTEFLSDVNKEIDRLSAIVSDLLTMVRADAHNMKLARQRMSLAAIVKEAAHRLKPLAETKEQQISLDMQDSGDMYADPAKLGQVVYNLMENAVKYTQAGGHIEVSLQRSGRDAVLTVQDNGPGISKENLSHVFERFFRVDKARSRETGGTGLGLSIAQQIVTLHDGTIRAESEEGQGTRFIVELPLHKG